MSSLIRGSQGKRIEDLHVQRRSDGAAVIRGTYIVSQDVDLVIYDGEPDADRYIGREIDWEDDSPERWEKAREQLRSAKVRLLQAIAEDELTAEAGSE